MSKHALIENAHYILPEYPPYRGNPFIEALPPILSLTMARQVLTFSQNISNYQHTLNYMH